MHAYARTRQRLVLIVLCAFGAGVFAAGCGGDSKSESVSVLSAPTATATAEPLGITEPETTATTRAEGVEDQPSTNPVDSSSSPTEDGARDAYVEYVNALASGDYASACSMWTDEAKANVPGGDCPAAMAKVLDTPNYDRDRAKSLAASARIVMGTDSAVINTDDNQTTLKWDGTRWELDPQ